MKTHPDARGRGLAGTLVHRVSRYGFDELGAQTLVMVADPDYLAIRIYRSVGFADTERQLQVERRPGAERPRTGPRHPAPAVCRRWISGARRPRPGGQDQGAGVVVLPVVVAVVVLLVVVLLVVVLPVVPLLPWCPKSNRLSSEPAWASKDASPTRPVCQLSSMNFRIEACSATGWWST